MDEEIILSPEAEEELSNGKEADHDAQQPHTGRDAQP